MTATPDGSLSMHRYIPRDVAFSPLCSKFVQTLFTLCSKFSIYLQKNLNAMTKKKDLEHLHVRIKPLTSEKLRNWSEDLGFSIGEVIDFLVENYEEECNRQDDEIETETIQQTLARLADAVESLERKIDQKK